VRVLVEGDAAARVAAGAHDLAALLQSALAAGSRR